MAKYSADILALARRGAAARWRELQAETAALLRQFPDLAGESEAGTAVLGSRSARRRQKRTMSAAQKRAVSARMKKYWAERRRTKKA